MPSSSSAILLATVGTPNSIVPATVSTQAHRAQLKAALDLPGAAIAMTGNGEYLGIYTNPAIALEAALSFQAATDQLAHGSPLAFTGRVVIELWPASEENMPIEHAREVLSQARENCLLVTAAFAGEMHADERAHLVLYDPDSAVVAMRGVSEYSWRDRATTFRENTRQVSLSRQDALYKAVKLTRRGVSVVLHADDCPFSIGRDAACALNVGGPNVSRLHGAVVYEGGKFYFRDDSRNGSYITSGGEEMFLHVERFPLVAQGVISPGATLVQQTGDVIRYVCLTQDLLESSTR